MSQQLNIVMVLSDQHHADALGFRRKLPVPTPHLDRIAAEGVCFDNAFCCTAICSPSRAALFTGLLPHRFGSVANDLAIPRGTPTLASALNGRGYRLGYAGKWHVDNDSLPSDHGFEGHDFPGYGCLAWMFEQQPDPAAMTARHNRYYEYLMERGLPVPKVSAAGRVFLPERKDLVIYGKLDAPPEATTPYFVADEAVGLVKSFAARRRRDNQPFFLWTNFWEPHNPCYLPEPYYSMVRPGDIPEPAGFRDPFTDKPRVLELFAKYWGMLGAPWSAWQEYLARYLGSCAEVDCQVGRIRAALEAEGQWENTVFVFTADHGDMMGRHQLMDKGPFMYDDTYRIPLMVCGPGISRGRCDELVYLQDLFPTILDLARAERLPGADFTQSLGPLLGRAPGGWSPREAVFGEFDSQIMSFPQRMVRTRTHKFVFNTSDVSELYDLAGDPDELHNRVADPALAGVKRELKDRLRDHLRRHRDPCARQLESMFPFV